MCGQVLPPQSRAPADFAARVSAGHDQLVSITGQDFGYDLQAWHDYLKESRDGGYTYGRNISLPKAMRAALDSPEWREAVQRLTARSRSQARSNN